MSRGSLSVYDQVRHREVSVQWIYSILLEVRISCSFSTDWGRNVRFNLTYVYTVWKILSFVSNFCNIFCVLAVTTRVNGKGHMSGIILCSSAISNYRGENSSRANWSSFGKFSAV